MDILKKLSITPTDYASYAKEHMPKSHTLLSCVKAFLVGGFICVIGEIINKIGICLLGLDLDAAASFTAIVMVFLGAFFTGLGVYDVLGRFAGAGSIVPITGFANSIVSPAMEFKREGLVLGTAAKMFTIAGPVLVYGIGTSVVIGLIYYILSVTGVV